MSEYLSILRNIDEKFDAELTDSAADFTSGASTNGYDSRDVDISVLQFLLLSPFQRDKSSIREEDSSARAGGRWRCSSQLSLARLGLEEERVRREIGKTGARARQGRTSNRVRSFVPPPFVLRSIEHENYKYKNSCARDIFIRLPARISRV